MSVNSGSVSSEILAAVTTANCEIAVLPLALLLELQPQYLSLESGTMTCASHRGGYNLFSDGSAQIDGRRCRIGNYLQRKVTLQSHADYKDYRETLFAKPMLFITNAKKVNCPFTSAKTFALIVNTRHPKVKSRVEDGMNNAISSVWGENYSLQISFQNTFRNYLLRQNFEVTEENLSFSYTFKLDVLLDISYLLGLSKKKSEMNGAILNLSCSKKEKKEKVKMFLSKMTDPLIRRGSSFNRDRRRSSFALDMILEDPFPPEENTNDATAPVWPPES
ncbi:mesenteric estrogen-dependent adipogenesis protein [Pseudophryne corroboree]|uniref:mesenteric estrogen-dependent adipogenesis protein n=1 Tax=Pseudophryne corroboree TaxID=495146 RepID=UPI0030821B90